jgi:hypothetical protein
MGGYNPPTYSLDDPHLASMRGAPNKDSTDGFHYNGSMEQFRAIDAPPAPPDLTDEAVKRAKQQQQLQGMSMTGYQSTFITGGS